MIPNPIMATPDPNIKSPPGSHLSMDKIPTTHNPTPPSNNAKVILPKRRIAPSRSPAAPAVSPNKTPPAPSHNGDATRSKIIHNINFKPPFV